MRAILGKNQEGLTLVEILVVVVIIAVLSVIGLGTYQQFTVRQRDDTRILELNRFAQKLELYKNEFGSYVCGENCVDVAGTWYSYDCSDTVGVLTGDDLPEETSGFLNGGECCTANGGYPAPADINDDTTWGLFRHGYLDSSAPQDPLEVTLEGSQFTYCYATPVRGRKTYSLFVRLESSYQGESDDGIRNDLYEVFAPNYPVGGWYSGYTP